MKYECVKRFVEKTRNEPHVGSFATSIGSLWISNYSPNAAYSEPTNRHCFIIQEMSTRTRSEIFALEQITKFIVITCNTGNEGKVTVKRFPDRSNVARRASFKILSAVQITGEYDASQFRGR